MKFGLTINIPSSGGGSWWQPSRITGSVFMAVTAVASIVGWIVAFITLCVLAADEHVVTIPGLAWFSLILALALTCTTLGLAMADNLHAGPYRATMAHFLIANAVLLVWFTDTVMTMHNKLSSVASHLADDTVGTRSALAAHTVGTILILLAQFAWVMYLTADEGSVIVSFVERFDALSIADARAQRREERRRPPADGKNANPAPQLPPLVSSIMSPLNVPTSAIGPVSATAPLSYVPATNNSGVAPNQSVTAPDGAIKMPTPAALSLAVPVAAAVAHQRQQQQQQVAPAAEPAAGSSVTAGDAPTELEPIQFNYRAQALFAYTADQSDPQELSFGKDEILEIANPHGNRWWQARNSKGQVGIAPSNYLKLLPTP
ncbi:Transmembrane osmosensor [Allomyces arbusculus]|nr:Transmembrane osmosensor [Allomyces arbusculus]